jgi:SulP family sulfate permease
MWKTDKRDFFMLVTTFLVTAFAGLELGIVAGVVLSILALVYYSARPHIAVLGELNSTGIFRNVERFDEAKEVPNSLIVRTDIQWYYANISFIRTKLTELLAERLEVKKLVLDASSISDMDSSAIHFVKDLHTDLQKQNIELVFVDMIGPVRDRFAKAGMFKIIGKHNFYPSINEALGGKKDRRKIS